MNRKENKKETASSASKKMGLRSLNEMSQISNVSVRTLQNWFKNNEQHFTILALGCVQFKEYTEYDVIK